MKNDFATKADLKNTADELHQEISALRTDLRETEASLRQDIDRVAVQVVQVSTDLNDFKHEIRQELRERFDGVMTAIDGLAGIMTDTRAEMAATNHALLRHDYCLDDHEKRIGTLEHRLK